jgi:hypothetical protein
MSERRQLRRNRMNESSDNANLVSDGNSTDTDTQHYDNPAFDHNEIEDEGSSGKSQIQAALIGKHRDKSREVAQRIPEEDPNAVVEELHVVRDRIKEKIKSNLANELLLAKSEEATEKAKDDKDKER